MDAARRRFLGHQQSVKEAELKRLDDQIKKKVQSREKETKAVLQDLEIRTVELEGKKARLEEELGRCQQEVGMSSLYVCLYIHAQFSLMLDVSAFACRG